MQTAEQQLLQAIEEMLVGEESAIAIPLTKMNQGIAQLSEENSKLITRMQGKILKSLARHVTAEDNDLELLSTVILNGLQQWQNENHLLLTQLAAKAGFTNAGDELEAALIQQVAEAPELAYSATLLLAIRDAFPYAERLIRVLEEIRDRMGGASVQLPGELPDNAKQAGVPSRVDIGPYVDGPSAE